MAAVFLCPVVSCVVLSDFDDLTGGALPGADAGADVANGDGARDAQLETGDGADGLDASSDAPDEGASVTIGVPVVVATHSAGRAWGLLADQDELFWTVEGLISDGGALASAVFKASQQCEGGACASQMVSSQSTKLTDIAVDFDWLYYGEADTQRIQRVHRDSGEVQVLAEGQQDPYGLALDASYVYWTGSEGEGQGYIRRALKAPASPDGGSHAAQTVLFGLEQPGFIAKDPLSDRIFWATDSGMRIQSCAPVVVDGGLASCANLRTHSAGTLPDSFQAIRREIFKIALDATHVYWREGERDDATWTLGAVRRASKSETLLPDGGSPSELLVDGPEAIHPRWISLDSSHVYWTVGVRGWVYRTTKEPGGKVEVLNNDTLLRVHSVVPVQGAVFVSTYEPAAVYRIGL